MTYKYNAHPWEIVDNVCSRPERDVDQCVEWFVRWFSVHREFDRIARQLSIDDVLHESVSIIMRLLER